MRHPELVSGSHEVIKNRISLVLRLYLHDNL